jgi:hypothetical protein
MRPPVCRFLLLLLAGSTLIAVSRPHADGSNSRGKGKPQLISKQSFQAASQSPSSEARARLEAAYGRLPLSFESNQGQADARVKFVSRNRGYALFLTDRAEAVLVLSKPQPNAKPPSLAQDAKPISNTVRMSLIGASRTPQVKGLGELPGKANYFIGNDPKKWRTNVPTFAKINYRAVYPGVDLIYYGNQGQVEHDFIVAPGADPSAIGIGIEGAEKLSIGAQGDLVLTLKDGEIRFQKPLIYQELAGVRHEIAGGYKLRGNDAGFKVAAYDPSKPLVIDPVLFYSTYLGSSGDDEAKAIAVDSSGNAYLTGFTSSATFPTTPGAFNTASAGGVYKVFISKLNPTGSGLVYSTYLGGTGADFGIAITVDGAGSACLTGRTDSFDFPTTAGAFQPVMGGGCCDAFATKLNSTGSGLVYSTYLGGFGIDEGRAITVDSIGNAYLIGVAQNGFPTTPGAFQPTFTRCCGFAVFVTKVNPAGTGLVYSTYLQGSGSSGENGAGIAVDSSANAYVTGVTDSPDFPTTAGAFQTTMRNGDAFVTKLNPTGSGLIYSTFLGGTGGDGGSGITVDAADNAYVSGSTGSTDFPTTPGAFQTSFGGGSADAFIAKLNPLGTGLLYSTYVGGAGDDQSGGIAIDASLNAYIAGTTDSTNFPTVRAVQGTFGGVRDAFVTKLNPLGSALVYSTYLGGLMMTEASGSRLILFRMRMHT